MKSQTLKKIQQDAFLRRSNPVSQFLLFLATLALFFQTHIFLFFSGSHFSIWSLTRTECLTKQLCKTNLKIYTELLDEREEHGLGEGTRGLVKYSVFIKVHLDYVKRQLSNARSNCGNLSFTRSLN